MNRYKPDLALRLLFLLLCIMFLQTSFAQKLQVKSLVCEYKNNPIGIDVVTPRLSWKLESPERNIMQTAYELRVGTNSEKLSKGKGVLWGTGKVRSDQSAHINYNGPALTSRQVYYWQVRVWDNNGNASSWSPVKSWEMGLLNEADWAAKWIQPAGEINNSKAGPALLLRKNFDVKSPVKHARLYITSHGLYEAELNGKRVSNAYFAPGWTNYNKLLQYQVYDVTALVKQGANAAGVTVGDGWYRGRSPLSPARGIYGNDISLLCQLEIEYANGEKDIIPSDESWKSSYNGPIRESVIYDGEIYDARMEQKGWSTSAYNSSGWSNVKVADIPKNQLTATYGPPAIKHETFKPVKIFKSPAGELIADFGQNVVGWVQLKLSGKAGTVITIKHAEVLDKKGNFYIANLRDAKQAIKYILKGGGQQEVYEPHFTYQGFRYVTITGFPGLKPDNLTAVAVYADMGKTGDFACSNAMLNQLQHNIEWGQKGNFLLAPTDCPQRDERLGWTGDAQAFFKTAAYNMDVATFFTKWMKDVKTDQFADGKIPWVIPNVLGDGGGSAGWGDVATIIPWNFYMAYGDERLLDVQYESMKNWVNYIQNNSKNDLWNTGTHFGDWLFYRPDEDVDGRTAITDKNLIAQCFYAYSTQILINTCNVLGKKEDAEKYTALLTRIKKAFNDEYVTNTGRVVSGSQTAYVLALNFDMLPEPLRAQAAERLVKNVRDYKNHLTTGFLGTPYLCHVLSRFGYTDVAYTLLLQDTYPSWLYPVKMGATTIWERWDGMKPDSTFQNPAMNSFNHYAYGAIGDWMYRDITGITEIAPGYKQFLISPHVGGNLTTASAGLETMYGKIRSEWNIKDGIYFLTVAIPANTTAKVILPHASAVSVILNGKTIQEGATENIIKTGDDVQLALGSGTWTVQYAWK